MVEDATEPLGVEVGEREMPDRASVAQIGKVRQRIEVTPVGVIPPVELKQVEGAGGHSPPRGGDGGIDNRARHRARARYPLGAELEVPQPLLAVLVGVPAAKLTDEVLGGSVVVGKVPRGEAGIDVRGHARERLLAVYAAVAAGDLPHAVQYAADREIGRECEPLQRGHCSHHVYPSEKAAADLYTTFSGVVNPIVVVSMSAVCRRDVEQSRRESRMQRKRRSRRKPHAGIAGEQS